jgi:hypothetical protein
MSRSGYSDDYAGDCGNWAFICWRGRVTSAIRGKRGQAFLVELIQALDTMPEKRLIAHDLRKGGEVCAIGALGVKRGVELEKLDPEDYFAVAAAFGVAAPLVQELVFENDEAWHPGGITPEGRWQRMRNWAVAQLRPESAALLTEAQV